MVQPRFASEGFSADEWAAFKEIGLIVRRAVLTREEVNRLVAAAKSFEDCMKALGNSVAGGYGQVLGVSQTFQELVVDARILGPAYDIFGELLSLHSFDLFIRPPGNKKVNGWHIDGPRRLPYRYFSPTLPMVLKFSIWLTSIPSQDFGAYKYIPGSHRRPLDQDVYGTGQEVQDEAMLLVEPGDITIHHCDLWHRVSPNISNQTRYNFFVAYSPSWLVNREPFGDPSDYSQCETFQTLLRQYPRNVDRIKPPGDEQSIHPDVLAAIMTGKRMGSPPILDTYK